MPREGRKHIHINRCVRETNARGQKILDTVDDPEEAQAQMEALARKIWQWNEIHCVEARYGKNSRHAIISIVGAGTIWIPPLSQH